jgi:hypothetical protein
LVGHNRGERPSIGNRVRLSGKRCYKTAAKCRKMADNLHLTGREPSLISRRNRARLVAAASGAAEISRETDLSAKQARTQAPPWLSHPHGHEGRPQGVGSAARAGPQKTECLSATGSVLLLLLRTVLVTRSYQSRCNGAVKTPE